jgi:hypothetical protein
MGPPTMQALALDLGNVLVKVDHLRFCRRLADLAGLTPEEVYVQVFESNLEPGYDTGRMTSEKFHLRVSEHFGVTLPFPQFCSWWNDIFAPMEGMAEIVSHLATSYPCIWCPIPTPCISPISGKTMWCLITSRASSCPLRWAAANRSRASTGPSSNNWLCPHPNASSWMTSSPLSPPPRSRGLWLGNSGRLRNLSNIYKSTTCINERREPQSSLKFGGCRGPPAPVFPPEYVFMKAIGIFPRFFESDSMRITENERPIASKTVCRWLCPNWLRPPYSHRGPGHNSNPPGQTAPGRP